MEPYFKRATFAAAEGNVDVVHTIAAEALQKCQVIENEDLDEVLVMEDTMEEVGKASEADLERDKAGKVSDDAGIATQD